MENNQPTLDLPLHALVAIKLEFKYHTLIQQLFKYNMIFEKQANRDLKGDHLEMCVL